jgi:hypothetical protein
LLVAASGRFPPAPLDTKPATSITYLSARPGAAGVWPQAVRTMGGPERDTSPAIAEVTVLAP